MIKGSPTNAKTTAVYVLLVLFSLSQVLLAEIQAVAAKPGLTITSVRPVSPLPGRSISPTSSLSSSTFAGGVSLGAAGPNSYTILSLGGQASISDSIGHTNLTLNNETIVQGNVGVAPSGGISTTGNAFVKGTLFLNTAGSWNHSGASGASAFSQDAATDAKLNQAVQDALNASALAAALPATQSITSISLGNHGTMTINGGAQNVLNLTGVSIGNNAVLTLNGAAGNSFILNISGDLTVQGRIVLSGGILPSDVLYNVTGTGPSIQFSGGGNSAQLTGILLTPSRDIQLSPGLINGELIGGGDILTLTSGADAIPEPGTWSLLGIGAAAFAAMSRLRKKKH